MPVKPSVQHLSDIQPALQVWAPWLIVNYGQHLVPLALALAALLSGFDSLRSSSLKRRTWRNPRSLVDGMDWREFEQVVGEIFKARGYSVSPTGAGADGGVDLIIHKGKVKGFVQCKQWKTAKVGVKVVRELYGIMNSEGVTEGYVVTCGTFTETARDFAYGLNIQLLDYSDLCEWMGSKR